MNINAKKIIVFSAVTLLFLAIGYYFFFYKVSPEEKQKCIQSYLEKSFNSGGSPNICVTGFLIKFNSCKYNETKDELSRKKIYDEVVMFSKNLELSPVPTELRFFYQSNLASTKDFLVNSASGNYQFISNELIFGDWENSCKEKLASLCRSGELPFSTATGIEQWCQNLCQKVESYKKDKSSLIADVINDSDEEFFQEKILSVAFKVALALRLGGSELANQVCDSLKTDKDTYNHCQNLISYWEVELKDCSEIKKTLVESSASCEK